MKSFVLDALGVLAYALIIALGCKSCVDSENRWLLEQDKIALEKRSAYYDY